MYPYIWLPIYSYHQEVMYYVVILNKTLTNWREFCMVLPNTFVTEYSNINFLWIRNTHFDFIWMTYIHNHVHMQILVFDTYPLMKLFTRRTDLCWKISKDFRYPYIQRLYCFIYYILCQNFLNTPNFSWLRVYNFAYLSWS